MSIVVKVDCTWSAESVVRQIGWPAGRGGHSPFGIGTRGPRGPVEMIAPRARVLVETALGGQRFGFLRHDCCRQ